MDNKSDRRAHHVIYKTTCLVTGRWYLGMHSTNNLKDGYYGSGTHLQRSLKKYGYENHKYEILETLNSRAELRIREQEILTEDFISDPLCMNIRFSCSAGNDPGFWAKKDRAATSKKISETSKAMWDKRKADPIAYAEHMAKLNTPEAITNRATGNRAAGHKRTPEQLQRMDDGQSKYYLNVDPAALKERGRKGAATRAKTWIIEDTEGKQQMITDIVKFSETLGIPKTALYKTEGKDSYRAGFRIVGRL
jgi:hypothetical protein